MSSEGLPALWERHLMVHKALWRVRSAICAWCLRPNIPGRKCLISLPVVVQGLGGLGLEPFVEDEKDRLISVNTIKVSCYQ